MSVNQKYTISDLVTSLDSIIRCPQEKTLDHALSQVNSSHSAAFVFDKYDTFLGLVSPYKTLYSSNYPYTTKVGSILFKPPSISRSAPLYEAADHMLATKIYTLPILNADGELQGVINGKDILQYVIDSPPLLQFISETIKPNKPITAHKNSAVKDVYHTLKVKGVSRIILVDDEGDLAGIVSRGDLMHAFIKPTPKQRFANEGTHIGRNSMAGEKKFRKDDPVLKYATLLVETTHDETPKETIVSNLIRSEHNSVVLVNTHNKPTGFLSIRDLLQAVSQFKPDDEIPLIMKKPSNSVSRKELELAKQHLTQFGKKLKKRMAIEKIETTTEEPKNGQGETKEFNTTLIVTPIAGKSLVAVTKQREFIDSIQEAAEIIEKQRRRNVVNRRATQRQLA